MQYRSKRLVSLMLVVLMVVAMFPSTALASETETLILGDGLVLGDNVTIITDSEQEPAAEEPAAEEPAAEEPVAEEPVAEEPVAEEPVAETPAVEAPVALALETGEEAAAYDGTTVVEVDTYAALVEALANGGEIKLTADITTTEIDDAPLGDDAVLDLNGHTIKLGSDESAICLYGDLTIKDSSTSANGAIHANDLQFAIQDKIATDGTPLRAPTITIESGTVNGLTVYYGATIYINGGNVTLYFLDKETGEFTAEGYAAYLASITFGSDPTDSLPDGIEAYYKTESGTWAIREASTTYVAKIDGTEYATFAEALTAASDMTGDVTVEIYDKVTLNSSFSGSYDSITFVGKDTDAEIYLDVQGYITATGKKVAFEDLTLSKSEGGFITNAGFMNVAFGVYDVTEVTYTDCTFTNGAYASSGDVTFTGCTFKRSHDKYGLWAYGDVDVTVDGCTFADYRGIKMYAEGAAKTVNLTVKNTDFSALTGKPAIVLTYGESVTLDGNTYSDTGVFELDKDGAPNGTAVTSDVAPTCRNDDGACGVLVDGKIYTTVAQAAEAATDGATVTLLHDSTETVELPEGVKLDTNGYTAENVTVAASAVAKIGETEYATIDAALDAADNGDTITLLGNVTMAEEYTVKDKTLTIEGDYTLTINDTDGSNLLKVAGVTTLNISSTLKGEVWLCDSAILKDSTINGNVFVAGKVIFRGDNTVAMLYDFGTLVDNYGADANMEWAVEAGSSLTMTNKARYGLGYGDNVTIYGTLTDAATARESTLPAASFSTHGLVAQDGWDIGGSFTAKNAYVIIGSNNSFGNKPGNYGGIYTFTFDNVVLDASRITFYEANSTTNFSFTNSDVVTGTFMTRDADSSFTLTNTTLLSTTTTNGTDEGNYNEGTLILVNSSLTYSAKFTNNGTLTLGAGSSLTAPSIDGTGTITIDATGMTEGTVATISADASDFTGTIEVANADGLEAEIDEDGNIVLVKAAVATVTNSEGNVTNYETLQEALKALTAGATLTLLNDVTIAEAWDERYTGARISADNITIDGANHTITFACDIADGGNYHAAFRLENNAATIKNLTIDMSAATNSKSATRIRAISSKAGDLTVDNCTFIGNSTLTNTRAIIFGEGASDSPETDIKITNSTFTDWRKGVTDNENAKDMGTVEITGNTFTNAGVGVSASNSITFTNNSVSGGAVNITSYSSDTLTVTATGNTLDSNELNIIKKAATVNAQAEFIVNPVAYIGSTYYETLADAIDAAQSGDTVVLLQDVTLSEILVINKAITLDGNGKTLTYTGSDRAIEMPSTDGAELDVSISNLTVDCTASYCQRGINYNDDGTLTLTNVTVKGASVTYALNLPGSSDGATVTINNSSLAGCIALNVWGENMVINATDSAFTSVDKNTAENYAAIVLNNDDITSAEGTVITINGGTITALDENGEASSAARNSTATGTIDISGTTVVTGNVINPVAIVSYAGTTDCYSFTTLQDAIDKATNDPTATVKLLADITLTEPVTINGDVVIDGNGKTLTSSASRVIQIYGENTEITMTDLNVVSTAVRVGTSDIRGININPTSTGTSGVKLTLNNCSVDFTDTSACDWAYGVNVTGTTDCVIDINGGTYEGANVINIWGSGHTVTIDDATLTSLYGANDFYTGVCVKVEETATVNVANTTFNGDNAVATENAGNGTITTTNCTDNTKYVVAKIGTTYYHSLAEAIAAAEDGDTVKLLADTTLGDVITIENAITLNLNGKTVTGADGAIVFNVKADTTIENGTILGNKSGTTSGLIDIYSNLTLDGVTLETSKINALRFKAGDCTATLSNCSVTGAFKGFGGSVWNIQSGTYKASSTSINDQLNGTASISGGTFHYEIAEDECAPGYVVVDNGDGTYGVTYAPACFVDANNNGVLDDGEAVYGNLDQVFANHQEGDVHVVLTANITANAQVDTDVDAKYYFTTNVAEGVTMDFLFADDWNYVQKMSIGKNITLNAPYFLGWTDIDIYGTVNTGYAYFTVADVTVHEGGVLNVTTGDATIQVKNGAILTVNGTVKTSTLNVWVGESKLIVSGANARVDADWIDIWDGTPVVTVENGATLVTNDIKASRGGSIAVDNATLTANNSLELGHNGESTGALTVTNNGTINGETKLTVVGSTLTGPESLNVVSGVEGYVVNYNEGVHSLVQAPIQVTYADGTVKYFTEMTDAVPDSNKNTMDGATITLITDYTGPGVRFFDDVTLNLNGKTYTVTKSAGSKGTETSGFQLRPESNGITIKNGTIAVAEETTGSVVWLLNSYTNTTLTDVTLDCTNLAYETYGDSCYAMICHDGEVNFTGEVKINGFNAANSVVVNDNASYDGGVSLTVESTGDLGVLVLNSVDTTITGPDGLTVTSGVEGYYVEYKDGVYSLVVKLPEVVVTDIKKDLTDDDPDLTFALNFAIKDIENLSESYLNALMATYGSWYTDYVLTISGLTDTEVTFNAGGEADGYLAGSYQAWADGAWVSVPFEDVTVANGQSLYIMEYAAKLMGQSGLRFTLKEVAEIVQNFDCGVYFTPEFLEANPNMKVTLELKVFTEDAEGNKTNDKTVAINEFYAANIVALIATENGQTQYFATLKDAIDAATDGDTVTLLKNVALTDTLIVDKAGTITIDGNDKTVTLDPSFTNTNAWGAAIMLGNSTYGDADCANHTVNLSNITFSGITGNSLIRAQGVTLNMDGCDIVNCDSTDTEQGLLRIDATLATMEGCTFTGNEATKIIGHNHNTSGSSCGITVNNCSFKSNTITGPGVIVLSSDAGATITNNDFVGNNTTCTNGATVYMGFSENNVVTGNLFKDNTVTGSVNTNRIAGALFVGWENEISGNAFVNNTATNNGVACANNVCADTAWAKSGYEFTIDLSKNYWGGEAPAEGSDYVVNSEVDYAFSLNSYYANYTENTDDNGVTLSGLKAVEVAPTNGEAAIGNEIYATLAEAIEAAKAGDFINILQDVETVPSIGKAVTIINNGGYKLGDYDSTMDALDAAVAEGFTVTDVAGMGMIFSIAPADPTDTVVAKIGNVEYTTVKAALEAAQADETVEMIADSNEETSDMIIPLGVTLDLNNFDLKVRSLAGANGSYVVGDVYSSTGADYANLKATTLVLGETAPIIVNAKGVNYNCIPIWNPTTSSYVFSLYNLLHDDKSDRGLWHDAENEIITFQFSQSLTGNVRTGLINDGTSDNKIDVIVQIRWEGSNGVAYQNYIYNDEFVTKVASNQYIYGFSLTNYSLLGIDETALATVKVQAMVVTDSGVIAYGEALSLSNAKTGTP